MKIGSVAMEGFTDEQRARLANICFDLVEPALNDPKVRQTILDACFDDHPGFANTDDAPQAVLDKIDAEPWKIHLQLYRPGFFRRWSSAIASTDLESGITQIWSTYLNNPATTDADLAETIGHEYLHVLLYVHDFENTARRPFSVPYEIGEDIHAFAAVHPLP